jgi:hypothetical protein
VPVYLERLRRDRALHTQEFAQLELARPPAAGTGPAAAYVEFLLSSGADAPRTK